MVARRAHNPKVVGSSPAPATTTKATIIVAFVILNHIVSSNNFVGKCIVFFHRLFGIITKVVGFAA